MNILDEIDKVILSEKRLHRKYIGASSIGSECDRKLWYRFKGYPEELSALALRRFEDGFSVEDRIINWIKQIDGIQLWDKDENGEQYGFSALDGRFKGHYDGVIKMDGTTYMLEIKASTKLPELVKLKEKFPEDMVLKEWNFEYYAQAMVYCHYANIKNHMLICADAGGRKLETIITPSNNTFAEALTVKAERIADSVFPPEKNGTKNFWKCKMCPFYKECWG